MDFFRALFGSHPSIHPLIEKEKRCSFEGDDIFYRLSSSDSFSCELRLLTLDFPRNIIYLTGHPFPVSLVSALHFASTLLKSFVIPRRVEFVGFSGSRSSIREFVPIDFFPSNLNHTFVKSEQLSFHAVHPSDQFVFLPQLKW
jgi:hypothetical protein